MAIWPDSKIAGCILAAVAVTLLVTSCANNTQSSKATMPYRYAGPVTEEHIWGNSVVADPVPAGTASTMTPEDLLGLCQQVATCGQGDAGPTISLALITTPNTGTARADGTLIPDMNKALGYVMVWEKQGCMPRRQLPTGAIEKTQAAVSDCTRVTVIDQASRTYVLSLLV